MDFSQVCQLAKEEFDRRYAMDTLSVKDEDWTEGVIRSREATWLLFLLSARSVIKREKLRDEDFGTNDLEYEIVKQFESYIDGIYARQFEELSIDEILSELSESINQIEKDDIFPAFKIDRSREILRDVRMGIWPELGGALYLTFLDAKLITPAPEDGFANTRLHAFNLAHYLCSYGEERFGDEIRHMRPGAEEYLDVAAPLTDEMENTEVPMTPKI